MNLRYVLEGEPGFWLEQLVDGGAVYSEGEGAGGFAFYFALI